jgi:PIN domain nuclease of toxin-antitoxin system
MLDINADHAKAAPALPAHHRVPFDRMIIAQAGIDGFIIVTVDAQFEAYGAALLDPRT